jgi:adenylate kinase family enzyme
VKLQRIHIMGASGAGVTTLGRALANALAFPHHDVDDYYWTPEDPPYRNPRNIPDRLRLMREVFLDRPDWVLSGSVIGWGESVVPMFEFVVFVRATTKVRLQRLRNREARHFGSPAVSPGGWRHKETEEFIEWASHYDDGSRGGRSLERHEAWLATLHCPVLRVDGTRPTAELVTETIATLASKP